MMDKDFPFNQEFPDAPYVWCLSREQEVCTHPMCQKWWEDLWCPRCGEKLERQKGRYGGTIFHHPSKELHSWLPDVIWKEPNRFNKPDNDGYDRAKILEALRNLTNKDVRELEKEEHLLTVGHGRIWGKAGDKNLLRIGEYVKMGKDGYLEPCPGGAEQPLGILESVRVEQETIEVSTFGRKGPRYVPGKIELFGDVRVSNGETGEFPIRSTIDLDASCFQIKTKNAGSQGFPSVAQMDAIGRAGRVWFENQIRNPEEFKILPTSFS